MIGQRVKKSCLLIIFESSFCTLYKIIINIGSCFRTYTYKYEETHIKVGTVRFPAFLVLFLLFQKFDYKVSRNNRVIGLGSSLRIVFSFPIL